MELIQAYSERCNQGHKRVLKQEKHLKMQQNGYVNKETQPFTWQQAVPALGMTAILHLAVISMLCGVINLSLSYSANGGIDVTTNGMVDILSSGVFDSRAGLNSSATSFFTQIAKLIFSVALPFMSAFAITMTTISLISSVIYLTKPDTFDEIDELHKERTGQGHKFTDLVNYGRDKGFRSFILSICPNIKAYAFADATEVGPEGHPTMKDFLRNIPKYIMIFAFCIVINDRAMLDFIMKGGQVGALVFERITYDYDYVATVTNLLDEGSDYKPVVWDTKTNEGANKMKVYKSIYNLLKTRCSEPEDRTTDSKTIMGTKLVNMIESDTFAGVGWDKDILTISVSYNSTPQGTAVEGIYTVPVATFLSSDSGVIYANIHTENQMKYNTTYANTTYPAAWVMNSAGKLPTEFDLTKVDELKKAGNVTAISGYMNCDVQYMDANGKSQASTTKVKIEKNKVKITLPNGASDTNISSIRLTAAGTITYTTTSSNGNKDDKKALILNSAVTWKNDNFSPATPTS